MIGVHYYLNLVTKKSQWEKPTSDQAEETLITNRDDNIQYKNRLFVQEEENLYENDIIEQEEQTINQSNNYGDRAQEQSHHRQNYITNHQNNQYRQNNDYGKEETLEPISVYYADSYGYQEEADFDEDGLLDDEPPQIKCSHIIVKHKHSRKPYSWRDDKITRTPKEALAIIKCILNYYYFLN